MSKTTNKFIVKLLDPSNFKPNFMVRATPVAGKDKTFSIKIYHPNPKLGENGKPELVNGKEVKTVVHEEEYVAKAADEKDRFIEAIAYGKSLLDTDKLKEAAKSVKWVEQIFIPAARRGRVKLKTKESVEQAKQKADKKAAKAQSVAAPKEVAPVKEKKVKVAPAPVVEKKKKVAAKKAKPAPKAKVAKKKAVKNKIKNNKKVAKPKKKKSKGKR